MAIASVTFAAGAFWGNRRDRKLPAVAASQNYANNGFSASEPVLKEELVLHNDNHHVKTKG
jgi:hypothetical protein